MLPVVISYCITLFDCECARIIAEIFPNVYSHCDSLYTMYTAKTWWLFWLYCGLPQFLYLSCMNMTSPVFENCIHFPLSLPFVTQVCSKEQNILFTQNLIVFSVNRNHVYTWIYVCFQKFFYTLIVTVNYSALIPQDPVPEDLLSCHDPLIVSTKVHTLFCSRSSESSGRKVSPIDNQKPS